MTPEEAEIKARDQLFRDALVEIAKEDRGRLMAVSVTSVIPETKIDFIDGVILLALLSQMGIEDIQYEEDGVFMDFIDFHDRHDQRLNKVSWSYEIDENGRIVELVVGHKEIEEYNEIPSGIFRLNSLVKVD